MNLLVANYINTMQIKNIFKIFKFECGYILHIGIMKCRNNTKLLITN